LAVDASQFPSLENSSSEILARNPHLKPGTTFVIQKQRLACSNRCLFMLQILSVIFFAALATLVHEFGHLVAARLCHVPASEVGLGMGRKLATVRVGSINVSFGLLPTGSFVMLDGTLLKQRSLSAQLFVHLGGIIFNLVAGLLTYGTTFSWFNFLLAAGNILPLYQHDGWKCGVVLLRALMQRTSQPLERAFTFSGGFVSLAVACYVARFFL
jgi:membrane-associated protease RseP (regulator of RpoE activity)